MTKEDRVTNVPRISIIHVTVTLILLDTSLMCVIVRILIGIGSEYNTARRPEMTYTVPCDDASLSVSEDLDMVRSLDGVYRNKGTNFCRFKNLPTVVSKASERNLRRRIAKGTSTERILACGNRSAESPLSDYLAHFTELETPSNTSHDNIILQWRRDPEASNVGKNLTYVNGRIGVNRGDFYYVYVSLAILQGQEVVQHLLKRGVRRRLMTSFVSIYKQNRMYEHSAHIRLLDNTVPVCENNDAGVRTVHIGSHIFLDKYDDVFVKVMNPHRLVPGSKGNAFGIFPQK